MSNMQSTNGGGRLRIPGHKPRAGFPAAALLGATILATAILLAALTGCQNPLNQRQQPPAEGGTGTLSLTIERQGIGRTILPNWPDQVARFRLDLEPGTGCDADNDPIPGVIWNYDPEYGTVVGTVDDIPAGLWNLRVTAYILAGETHRAIAVGYVENYFQISADEETPVSVSLRPLREGTGTFRWNIGFPANVYEAHMTITPVDDPDPQPLRRYFVGGTPETTVENAASMELEADQYRVVFVLRSPAGTAAESAALRIYWNMESLFEHVFQDYHFLAAPGPTTVTVTPATMSLVQGQSHQFNAAVLPIGAAEEVEWSVTPTTAGTITETGHFTLATDATPGQPVTITATAVGHPGVYGTATVTVLPRPISITLTPNTATVYEGQSLPFTATMYPANAATGFILSVDPYGAGIVRQTGGFIDGTAPFTLGLMAAEAGDTVTFTVASFFAPEVYGTITVTVTEPEIPPPAPTSISVTPGPTVSVLPTATQAFTAWMNPPNAHQGVIWTVEPPTAGTITVAGAFTFAADVAVGDQVTVRATSIRHPEISGTSVITVAPVPTGVQITPTEVNIGAGQTYMFAATVLPASAVQNVQWIVEPAGAGTWAPVAPGAVNFTVSPQAPMGQIITLTARVQGVPVATAPFAVATITVGEFVEMPLPAPTVHQVTQWGVNWSQITGAAGYRIYANDIPRGTTEGQAATDFNIANNANPPLAAGPYTITVVALGVPGESLNSAPSAPFALVPQVLTTPTISQVSGGVLWWSQISGATGYRIYANGTPIGATVGQWATYFNLGQASPALVGDSYELTVVAIGALPFQADSPPSAAHVFDIPSGATALPARTNLRVEGTWVNWDFVSDDRVAGFRIYADGTPVGMALYWWDTSFNLANANPPLPLGDSQITVVALGVPGVSLNSPHSEPVTFTVIAPTGVTLYPLTASLAVRQSMQFTATLQPSEANQAVTWSVYPPDAGHISWGHLTLFGAQAGDTVTVRAAATMLPTVYAQATVTVLPPHEVGGTISIVLDLDDPLEGIIAIPDTVSLAQSQSIQITNTTGLNQFRWMVDGSQVPGTSTWQSSLMLDANVHGNRLGTHRVTLEVQRAGRWYSRVIIFEVGL